MNIYSSIAVHKNGGGGQQADLCIVLYVRAVLMGFWLTGFNNVLLMDWKADANCRSVIFIHCFSRVGIDGRLH